MGSERKGPIRLTETAAERYKPEASRRDIKDAVAAGLYLRIEPSGAKLWYFRYRIPARNRSRFLKLGRFPTMTVKAARAAAAEHWQTIQEGGDPAAAEQQAKAERRRMPTVEEFVPEYIERHARPNKKEWKADERMLTNWVVPQIGLVKLDQVHRRDVQAVIDACRDAGNTTQPGKVLAVTRRMFRLAVERGVLDNTPVQFIRERQPPPRDRSMAERTVAHWWHATGEAIESETPAVPLPMALALRLLLLTGQRPGEVSGLRLDELDLDHEGGPLWRIPGERRKRGKSHAVALTPEAVRVVELARERVATDTYLFPTRDGGPGRVDSGLIRSLGRLFHERDDRPTPHDARHTVATELEGLEFEEGEVARVLGHHSPTVTGRYINRRSLTAQRRALEAWEGRLFHIAGGRAQPANVVALTGASG